MPLTRAQLAMIERARSIGAGGQGVALTDDACAFLVCTMARDLNIPPEIVAAPPDLPDFFARRHPGELVVQGRNFLADLTALVGHVVDADLYFTCLAKLHKSRLKYQRILETQPRPTMNQVGPRGLLQYGQLTSRGLVGLLLWRKWFFDIDNRAGQETGYLFEPIVASSIGGVPVGARNSPIKRVSDNRKGRQVDCLKDMSAYEIKLRVTIAASGQGRWREELEFPVDCRASGYRPILVVLDPTENPKLSELQAAFATQNGLSFVGDAAWAHLEDQAGPTMSAFLERYVRRALRELIDVADEPMPRMLVRESGSHISIEIGDQTIAIPRTPLPPSDEEPQLPDDVDEAAGGP